MRPTPRGWVAVAAVVLAVLAGAAYGSRGLNAFAAPGVVALGAAAWQLYQFEPPTVAREVPARGERGGTARVHLHLETDTPLRAHVHEELSAGLEAPGAAGDLVLGEGSFDYDVELTGRGEQVVGPTTVVVRDVLGLLERTVTDDERSGLLVRPRVHRLAGSRADALAWLHGGAGQDRQAFDALRRYQRGDPLREIHWKSSAKQPDEEFVVKQYAVEQDTRTVEVAMGATPETVDAVADATASVVVALLDAGVRVALSTPDDRIDSAGPLGRRILLDHLARVGPGRAPSEREADVAIDATASGVRVEVGGRVLPFSALAATATLDAESPAVVAP